MTVYHSHFPLDCEPSELCGLLNHADVMILSWTATIFMFLFEMEGGEAGLLHGGQEPINQVLIISLIVY
jgi:hypothetical protein